MRKIHSTDHKKRKARAFMIDFSLLNDVQRQAAQDTEGAVLVFAGAGSGKTRVLTMRIANILDQGLAMPYEILAITFTNKAANEMKERLLNMGLNANDMWVCTIHSMCTRILRRDVDKIGYDSNFSIYSDVEKQRIVKAIIVEKGYDEDIFKSVLWNIGNAKASGYSPEEYEKLNGYNRDISEICEVYAEYESRLMKNNALDFDDLLTKTYELLSTSEETRSKYSEKFKYVHIDEFQDVNDIQYKIVKLLCKNHGNLFAVGDDDQSIYGFRGANVNNILNFERDYPSAKTYKLEQNYRSTKKILEAANRIICKNQGRADKKLWCDNDDGVRIEYRSLYDEREEAAFVAGSIKSLTTYSGYSYSDIAVLYRINSLSRSFEQEFLKYNIPSKVFGGQKFYERKEIKDLTAYIRAVVNPKDNEAIRRIINVPKRGIGDTTVDKLEAIAKRENVYLYELLANIEERSEFNQGTKNKLMSFRGLYAFLIAESKDRTPEEFVRSIIDSTSFMEQFSDSSEESKSRRLNVEEFVHSVGEFCEKNEGSSISDYLQSITLSSAIDDLEDDDNAVTLATVHAVKGLEFKVVFIVGLDEKLFPIVRPDTKPTDLEEERRLMYVAVTRAMERLYMTRCDSRYSYQFGERMPQMRSRYIDDIKDLLGIPEKVSYEAPAPKTVFTGSVAKNFEAPKPKVSASNAAYSVGDNVEHKKFGDGVVVGTKGEGESLQIDVAFKGFGVKTLVARFAPIKKK